MSNENGSARKTVQYRVSLIGSIQSHLAGLQGYDVMALELIQNADDAHATDLTFDIRSDGLYVENSGQFSYCGNLAEETCNHALDDGNSCDFHRISEVASGGKLTQGDNIGRFGIGFVSSYQITDRPEIRSHGVRLVLDPVGESVIEPFDKPSGTTFFLPWATDPESKARKKLGSPMSEELIDVLTEDFTGVLKRGLLFLRHVQRAEVRRNGELLLQCVLERPTDATLSITFGPKRVVERWHILRCDAKPAAASLCHRFPRLAELKRKTEVSIGLRIDPAPLDQGFLYAFLPTEQQSGLPVHINADFFPEADRKTLIFAGHQEPQVWNEMLVETAAKELARDPEFLLQLLGFEQLWRIFSKAYDLSRSSNRPACFVKFWDQLKHSASRSRIAIASDGSAHLPSEIYYPRVELSSAQVDSINKIGGRVVHKNLHQFAKIFPDVGLEILTFERLVALMVNSFSGKTSGQDEVEDTEFETFYLPLWGVINALIPESASTANASNPIVEKLIGIPFVVTEDKFLVTINHPTYHTAGGYSAADVVDLFPTLAVASQELESFPRINRLIAPLNLNTVAHHLSQSIKTAESASPTISVAPADLKTLYSFLARLDQAPAVSSTVYLTLKALPIWLSTKGLVRANEALLPGDFTDPTGEAELLDQAAFTDVSRGFVISKLGVKCQTIEAFVEDVLPKYFGEHGPNDPTKYQRLMTELAGHRILIDDEKLLRHLTRLQIVPTQSGNWSIPGMCYRRSEDLIKVLGDDNRLWVDDSRLPPTRSVSQFIDNLGIRRYPIARHLVDRMKGIAANFKPTSDAKRASSEAFYFLCEKYEGWKENPAVIEAIADLKGTACFPEEDDNEKWYSAASVYAPFQAEGFRSQALILDFKNNQRLNTDLMRKLGVLMDPPTHLFVNHLLHCVKANEKPHVTTYTVLSQRASKREAVLLQLREKSCIYVDALKGFVRPNQIYWSVQHLGRYAFGIPNELELYKPFFDAIGVKATPDAGDYVDFVLDIVGEYFEQSRPLLGADLLVYLSCLNGISAAVNNGDLGEDALRDLQEAPCVLNLSHHTTHPDEILLQDSEWLASLFGEDFNRALCKPSPEFWPLLELVGVKRLSRCTEVELEFVDGPSLEERGIAQRLRDRAPVLVRLLHDRPSVARERIFKAFSGLSASSHDLIRIQANAKLGDSEAHSPPSVRQAFYDLQTSKLIVARPVGDSSWPHIFNAVLYQLLPEESGNEISKFAFMARTLMEKTVEDGHRLLTEAGVPELAEAFEDRSIDLTSAVLRSMGDESEGTPEDTQRENDASAQTESPQNPLGERSLDILSKGSTQQDEEEDGGVAPVVSNSTDMSARSRQGETTQNPLPFPQKQGESATHVDIKGSDNVAPALRGIEQTRGNDGKSAPVVETDKDGKAQNGSMHGDHRSALGNSKGSGSKKQRSKHKDQWDRRLLSYVRKRTVQEQEAESDGSLSEHNLAVEVVARDAVCKWEAKNGRSPVQMPQTHPGYDIISTDPLTGEQRYIEVKGVNGEWNMTGVGLSRTQFSDAQNFGESYWLYVVEFVSDADHIDVHPIQNPAGQVGQFMFDGNWRDAVSTERFDPALAFVPGAQVNHKSWGLGAIESVKLSGVSKTRFMIIDFGVRGKKPVTLNLEMMAVVEEQDGNDAS